MTTTNILGGGIAQPPFGQNDDFTCSNARFYVGTTLTLADGQMIYLPVTAIGQRQLSPAELAHLAALSMSPVQQYQVTERGMQ